MLISKKKHILEKKDKLSHRGNTLHSIIMLKVKHSSIFYDGSKCIRLSQAPVAHTFNPSYSWGRDQEEKPFTKNWAGGVTQGEGPELKPQYFKRKNSLD
jgi:hypothetical protein